nr:adenylate kinase [Bacilli bacterium]
MKKIIVIGPGGSGKSYFSKELKKILNINVYHLDNIFWDKNKNHLSDIEFDKKLDELLKKESYIIDGDYSRTYEKRIKEADTIFFFNFSLEDSLNGASSRVGTLRSDCPFIENEFDPEFKEFLINWQI